MTSRQQTRLEEVANSLSHGLGAVAALIGSVFLMVHAARNETALPLIAASIFSATMLTLYLSSTIYHSLPAGKAKSVFRVIEHSAIFLLIAGTYTPFTLGVLQGALGWTLLALVWGIAAIGVALKAFGKIHPVASTVLYLLMGWLIVIAIVPLYERLPTAGFVWLVAGGVAYTLGVIFYLLDSRFHFSHFIWHLFVLLGTTCHFFSIYEYAV